MQKALPHYRSSNNCRCFLHQILWSFLVRACPDCLEAHSIRLQEVTGQFGLRRSHVADLPAIAPGSLSPPRCETPAYQYFMPAMTNLDCPCSIAAMMTPLDGWLQSHGGNFCVCTLWKAPICRCRRKRPLPRQISSRVQLCLWRPQVDTLVRQQFRQRSFSALKQTRARYHAAKTTAARRGADVIADCTSKHKHRDGATAPP